jgi:hypothetical protein
MIKWVYVDLQDPLKVILVKWAYDDLQVPLKRHSGQMSIRRPTGILKKSNFLSFCFCFLFVSRMPLLYSVYFMDNVYVLLCNLVYFFTNTICKCLLIWSCWRFSGTCKPSYTHLTRMTFKGSCKSTYTHLIIFTF